VEGVPVGYRDRPEDSPSKLNTVSTASRAKNQRAAV
jgi:hypothetical protein